MSRAIGRLAEAVVKESEKRKKDFGELVCQCRKERGLPVLLRDHVLPELPTLCTRSHLAVPALPTNGANRHEVEGEARLRARIAEFRAWHTCIPPAKWKNSSRPTYTSWRHVRRRGMPTMLLWALLHRWSHSVCEQRSA
jgi:hypothetical protein